MHEVTAASMREWLARPEWRVLIALLKEQENDAQSALLAADPRDTSAIARAQTQTRLLREFTSGAIEQLLKSETRLDRPDGSDRSD
jgi:hypothetical protein